MVGQWRSSLQKKQAYHFLLYMCQLLPASKFFLPPFSVLDSSTKKPAELCDQIISRNSANSHTETNDFHSLKYTQAENCVIFVQKSIPKYEIIHQTTIKTPEHFDNLLICLPAWSPCPPADCLALPVLYFLFVEVSFSPSFLPRKSLSFSLSEIQITAATGMPFKTKAVEIEVKLC